VPPTRRPRAHHRVNPYLGARRQNETKMFSDHDETSPSITAVNHTAPTIMCCSERLTKNLDQHSGAVLNK